MNLQGKVLSFYVPEFVRRRALGELFQSTAKIFGVPIPALTHVSADGLLERYAKFTTQHAAVALHTGVDLTLTRQQLYDSAYAVGSRLRNELAITSTRDAMAIAHAVYGMLRIDFRQIRQGDVRIRRCFFSGFYSAAICELMSSLDQGLLAGLSAGGKLEFRRRITEGAPWCSASFREASL